MRVRVRVALGLGLGLGLNPNPNADILYLVPPCNHSVTELDAVWEVRFRVKGLRPRVRVWLWLGCGVRVSVRSRARMGCKVAGVGFRVRCWNQG